MVGYQSSRPPNTRDRPSPVDELAGFARMDLAPSDDYQFEDAPVPATSELPARRRPKQLSTEMKRSRADARPWLCSSEPVEIHWTDFKAVQGILGGAAVVVPVGERCLFVSSTRKRNGRTTRNSKCEVLSHASGWAVSEPLYCDLPGETVLDGIFDAAQQVFWAHDLIRYRGVWCTEHDVSARFYFLASRLAELSRSVLDGLSNFLLVLPVPTYPAPLALDSIIASLRAPLAIPINVVPSPALPPESDAMQDEPVRRTISIAFEPVALALYDPDTTRKPGIPGMKCSVTLELHHT